MNVPYTVSSTFYIRLRTFSLLVSIKQPMLVLGSIYTKRFQHPGRLRAMSESGRGSHSRLGFAVLPLENFKTEKSVDMLTHTKAQL